LYHIVQGIITRKSLYLFSTDSFLKTLFSVWLVEPVNAEPMGTEGSL
jgi:hypothetical protein